ncbi:MAG: HAMP domain-containing histidine kinase [Lachnospiraceae bacterium]|nr:HAMP domain-containing histidine kinase [Lachnospiraceae bacterium]
MIKKTKAKITGILILVYMLFFIFILIIYSFLLRKENEKDISKALMTHFKVQTELKKGSGLGEAPANLPGDPPVEEGNSALENEDASSQLNGNNPPPDDIRGGNENYPEIERPIDIYSVYWVNEDFSVYYNSNPDIVSDNEIIKAAKSISKKKQQDGLWSKYQYEITVWDKGYLIAFTDISDIIKKEKISFWRMVMIGIISLFFYSGFVLWLSKYLVSPLEIAMKKQSEFLLAAGHELKTPISVIETSHTMMRRENVNNKYLDYAEEELENMSQLVKEMLEVSKLDDYSLIFEKSEINLSKCIEGATLPFEAMAYEKGVSLKLDIEPDISYVGSENHLARLTGILIDNAIRHTNSGDEVLVTLKKIEGKIKLSIKNQGDPIPENEQKNIFNRFYQVDSARHREKGRYGLGLTIASEIAKRHKTEIKVKCKDGWTEFFLEINKNF